MKRGKEVVSEPTSYKMRILIAPDKFKGSLGAGDVARNIAAGLRDVLRDVIIEIAPVADGGEGTADVLCNALGGSWVSCAASDPFGRPIEARYGWSEERKLALMEMSEAAGMRRLREGEQDPMRANTFGVGEMIHDARKRGANEIILGLGGSATNDGGIGMAQALGFRFIEDNDHEKIMMSELVRLMRIECSSQLSLPKIIAAADVRNPLLGAQGATRVFGPQKGATADQIEILERALTRLAVVVAEKFGRDFRNLPGAGAAGGLGFGLLAFCNATLRSGFDVVADAIDLAKQIRDADVVITGEGRLDRQTLEGKAPAGVAQIAREQGKRVFAMVGSASDHPEVRELFDAIFPMKSPSVTREESIHLAPELLRARARELATTLL